MIFEFWFMILGFQSISYISPVTDFVSKIQTMRFHFLSYDIRLLHEITLRDNCDSFLTAFHMACIRLTQQAIKPGDQLEGT